MSFPNWRALPMTPDRPAFLLHTTELENHFAPIWHELSDTGFDVLLYRDLKPSEGFLKAGFNARVRSTKDVLKSRERYSVLVSNHPVKLPKHGMFARKPMITRLAATNLRMMYAAGKSRWNMADWNRVYDGVLCFGPHHAEAFSTSFGLPTVQMGYPRFDKFFNTEIDLTKLRAHYRCDPAKPVVVWLPTWQGLSSVDHFNDEIAGLVADFNVVVKVHPLMPADEPERVQRLEKLGFNVLITDTSDNVPLYQIADYMLFDYGGPAFAAIYTNKRFVLLNVPNAAENRLSGADSPDVLLRQTLTHVNPGAGALAGYLKNGAHWDRHMDEIAKLRKTYFVDNFGTSARAAAAAILDRSWLETKGKREW